MNYSDFDNVSKSINNIKKNCIYFCFSIDIDVIKETYERAMKLDVLMFVAGVDIVLDKYLYSCNVHDDFVVACQKVYNFSNTNMNYVGITGTNGKTSIAQIVNRILNRLDKASYLGTSGLIVNNNEVGYNGLTTPFSDMLYESIKLVDEHSNYFVMEVSSHALSQNRIDGLKYDVVAFTNMSEDHLDFHEDMDDYFNQKKKLLEYINNGGVVVINNDDEYLKKIKTKNLVTVGTKNSDFHIINIQENINSTIVEFVYKNMNYSVKVDLIAKFNAYNYVMSVAIIVNLGYNINDVIKHSNNLSVSGRMQVLKTKDSPSVILDFAHSPDSIKKVLKFAKSVSNARIITVTGSAGDRDKQKRSQMGYLCNKYSDEVIFTEDDPRNEDVIDIINDLQKDIVDKSKVVVIENRILALRHAISNKNNDDIIILLGKSGQTLMYYDGYTKEYDEVKQASLILEECYG